MQSSVFAVRLAAGAAFVVAIALAREVRPFCRTVTHLPPADWNAATQGCFIDDAAGAKALFWKNSCVGYSLHDEASRLATLEQATAIVAAAFGAWTSAVCEQGGNPSVRAIDLGPVDCGKVQYAKGQPNQNVILFHDDAWPYSGSDSTLGLTTLTFDTTTGEILGADMELNGTQNLVVGDVVPPGSYDLASVITHEAGHFLGLAHSVDASAVMFAQYKAHARLAIDDLQGICAIYAPAGTRATTDGPVVGLSCDPTPHGGFTAACSSPGGVKDDAESGGGCSVGPRPASGDAAAVLSAATGLALFVLRRRQLRSSATAWPRPA